MTKRMSEGFSAKAQSAANWLRRKTQGPVEGTVGEATKDGVAPTVENPAVTLEQAIASAKTMLATPIGQRMVDYARASIHEVAPEDIARHGIEGARKWLGPNHPLLMKLHEDPARVFDEMSAIVGLTGEPWWKARGHFVAMMADEADGTPASPPAPGSPSSEAAAPHAEAEHSPAAVDETVAPQDDGGGAEDASDPSDADVGGEED
jgi:hypothetical protein